MRSPVTKVLLKIFATGFYQMHAGLLVFLFGTFISYCFFINTLGSVPVWAFTRWNLIITLALVSSPVILGFYALTCLAYTLKSWQYISNQIRQQDNLFFFYSVTALPLRSQFITWFVVQFHIFLPIWIYTCFAAVIGFIFGYQLLPCCIIIYLILLQSLSALYYTRLLNRLQDKVKLIYFNRFIQTWKKPLFSLFSYYTFDQLKLTYLVTKLLSFFLATGMYALLSSLRTDLLIPGCIVLTIVTTHSVLLYQEYKFNVTYLSFVPNLPYSRFSLFNRFMLNYLILILPEILWLFSTYTLIQALVLLLTGFIILIFFRSLTYLTGINMKQYLFYIFTSFNLLFLMLLYQVLWFALPIIALAAWFIFIRNRLHITALP